MTSIGDPGLGGGSSDTDILSPEQVLLTCLGIISGGGLGKDLSFLSNRMYDMGSGGGVGGPGVLRGGGGGVPMIVLSASDNVEVMS